ncbi:MAG: DinB family protein [Longimicrobiales bacterium]
MKTYNLYLESGPRQKKTMVHVLDLLGCIAKGPTTDEALANTPDAIRAFLRFLKDHGEAVDLREKFETQIAQHIMQGQWLGNGDPYLVFEPDLQALTPKEIKVFIPRLEAMRAEVLDLVGVLSDKELAAEPKPKGRSIQFILEHMLESEHFYLSSLGKIEGLPSAGNIIQKRQGDLFSWMIRVRQKLIERLHALTPEERILHIERWKQTWSARKAMRHMLEHEWEHLVELRERLTP